jgi:hypothetical protein
MNGEQQLWAIFWVCLFSFWAFCAWCNRNRDGD